MTKYLSTTALSIHPDRCLYIIIFTTNTDDTFVFPHHVVQALIYNKAVTANADW